jgi:hypothetical protein
MPCFFLIRTREAGSESGFLHGLFPRRAFISRLSCAGVHDNAGVRLGQEKSIRQASFVTIFVF